MKFTKEEKEAAQKDRDKWLRVRKARTRKQVNEILNEPCHTHMLVAGKDAKCSSCLIYRLTGEDCFNTYDPVLSWSVGSRTYNLTDVHKGADELVAVFDRVLSE